MKRRGNPKGWWSVNLAGLPGVWFDVCVGVPVFWRVPLRSGCVCIRLHVGAPNGAPDCRISCNPALTCFSVGILSKACIMYGMLPHGLQGGLLRALVAITKGFYVWQCRVAARLLNGSLMRSTCRSQ
jgi:hypothetical protein